MQNLRFESSGSLLLINRDTVSGCNMEKEYTSLIFTYYQRHSVLMCLINTILSEKQLHATNIALTCSIAYSFPASWATWVISSAWFCRPSSRQREKVRFAVDFIFMLIRSERSSQWRFRMPGFLRPRIKGRNGRNSSILVRISDATSWQAE